MKNYIKNFTVFSINEKVDFEPEIILMPLKTRIKVASGNVEKDGKWAEVPGVKSKIISGNTIEILLPNGRIKNDELFRATITDAGKLLGKVFLGIKDIKAGDARKRTSAFQHAIAWKGLDANVYGGRIKIKFKWMPEGIRVSNAPGKA
jgi:hypothetical protein